VPKVQVPGKSSKPAKAVPPPKPVLAPPAGNLVIIGGGLRAENAEVWQRIVQLAGGKGARIGVFGSASINPRSGPGHRQQAQSVRRPGVCDSAWRDLAQ
jgi:cyanophycinase